jgi:hypothetical protein
MSNLTWLGAPENQWFWAAINCALICITVFVIWRQLRLQRFSHVIQSMFLFDQRWRSAEMLTARREVCEHYAPDEDTLNRPEDFVSRFFEDLGTYVIHRALPLRFVWSTFGYDIEHYWPMLFASIRRLRQETGDITLFVSFERLHRRFRRYGRWRSGWRFALLPVDLARFCCEETQTLHYYSELRKQTAIILAR